MRAWRASSHVWSVEPGLTQTCLKMTAEIAILNKNAVALAADSAVTLRNPESQKVYNTANKLFMLSKYHPVGIMIFGPAYFMGVPWETVIKMYRNELYTTNFGRLVEFAESFLSFLGHSKLLFPDTSQAAALETLCGYPLWSVRNDIDTEVKSQIEQLGGINDGDTERIVTQVTEKHVKTWANYRRLPQFPENFEADIINIHRELIDRVITNSLVNLPREQAQAGLREICAYRMTRDWWSFDSGGIVIAGFGKNDIFPVVHCYAVEAVVHDQLKYDHRPAQSNDVSESGAASIIPFAQGEIVYRFIQGMDPEYKRELGIFLSKLLSEEYPELVSAGLAGKIPANELQVLKLDLSKRGNEIAGGLWDRWVGWEHQKFVGPVLDIVGDLPKDDLAAMAESLVNLTSFKRRITAETETVGGPIDVAVISKGDGFVWIKRKHYFQKDLNPAFFANYYRRED